MTTLSLPTCKRLHELLPDLVTEKTLIDDSCGESEALYGLCGHNHHVIPAPLFSEVIRLLPKLGEKSGLSKQKTDFHCCEIMGMYRDAPTESEAMQKVDEYLYELIKE